MKRGDIWTVAGDKDYAGKPRPVVIIQDDSFDATDSITICGCTTDETDAPLSVRRTERAQRAAHRLPTDGGQDHHGPKVQDRRKYRAIRRRGHPAPQSGRYRFPRLGRVAETEAVTVRMTESTEPSSLGCNTAKSIIFSLRQQALTPMPQSAPASSHSCDRGLLLLQLLDFRVLAGSDGSGDTPGSP